MFDTRDANGDYQTSEYFDAREVLLSSAPLLRCIKPQAVAGSSRQHFPIDGLSKQADLTLINEQGLSVDHVVVENSYVQMTGFSQALVIEPTTSVVNSRSMSLPRVLVKLVKRY